MLENLKKYKIKLASNSPRRRNRYGKAFGRVPASTAKHNCLK